jgi:hypothetical protein
MELRLLGPVEVLAGGRSLPVGVPQRRAVLAALAVDVGRLVNRETLIDRVWDEPSARAVATVYVHVTHLRRMLDQINADGDRPAPVSLDRRTGGYLLRLDPQEVDLHRLRRLVGAARAADRPSADRVRLLRQAVPCSTPDGPLPRGRPGGTRDDPPSGRVGSEISGGMSRTG